MLLKQKENLGLFFLLPKVSRFFFLILIGKVILCNVKNITKTTTSDLLIDPQVEAI